MKFLKLPNNRGKILLYKADLSCEPQIEDENEPLIVFSGYNTIINPDKDIPGIIENTLKEKFLISKGTPSWLLLWSEHSSLASLDNEVIRAIDQFCKRISPLIEKLFIDHYKIMNTLY